MELRSKPGTYLTVDFKQQQPAVTLAADPETILAGQSAVLTWVSEMAETCSIAPDIGAVELSGAMEVTPEATTTYTITASGPGGTATADATVTVADIDLVPAHIDTSETRVSPQTLELSGTVDVAILNTGSTDVAESFEVLLFEDADHDGVYTAGSDPVLGSGTVPAGDLPAEGQAIVSIPVDSPVAFRDNRIFAWVDAENAVLETDETNNISHNMADCEFIPPVGGFDPVVEWSYPGNYDSVPMVINLNDDNDDGVVDLKDIPDIVFVKMNDWSVHAISGDGSGELFSIPRSLFCAYRYSSPAVGDIDNDGLPEILAIDSSGKKIGIFENDGSLKWISESLSIYLKRGKHPRISIADIDQDGSPEILYADQALNADGTVKWHGTKGYGRGAPCVANMDLDGNPEVVSGNTVYRSNGDVYWTNPTLPKGFTAIADFDDDPFPEIVLIASEKVYLLEHNGEVVWEKDLPGGGRGGAPCIADYDADEMPEIGVAGANYYTVFETNGSVKWSSPIKDYSSHITGSSVFDFEGDGSAEVVYGDETHFRIYQGSDGTVLFEIENSSHTALEYPVVADVDNDNNAEIVLPSQSDGLRIIGDANDTWVNTRNIWNQYNYHITNIDDNGTIPRIAANNWETYNNFRQNEMLNPFDCKDISASYIRIDHSEMPDTAAITARIGNGGALHIAPGVEVSFYSGDPAENGDFLGKLQIDARLDPGEYQDVTFQWEDPAPGVTTLYVRADDNGSGRGVLSEIDEENNLAFAEFSSGNHAPVADAGVDRSLAVGETACLDGSGSHDPEQDSLSYHWEWIEKPSQSGAELSSPTVVSPCFVADLPGEYLLQLTVNDGVLDSNIDMVTITAKALVDVPEITGLSEDNGESSLASAGLVPGTVTREHSAVVAEGRIMSQDPAAGTQVMTESPVDYVVSLGVQTVTVPDVTGMSRTDAESALASVELSPGTVTQEYTDVQPEGYVFFQEPASGEQVPSGTAVDLTVSLGPWSGEDETPPQVTVTADPLQLEIGDTALITVTAHDNVGVTQTILRINGEAVSLDGDTYSYTAAEAGLVIVEAEALDAAGLSGTAETVISVFDPSDTTPPEVSLDDTDCVDVTEPYAVYGSVSDASGFTYQLEFREKGGNGWTTLAEGEGSQISGELGVLDTTLLPNGIYDIRLYAADPSGNAAQAMGCAIVDGSMKLGQVSLPTVDLSLPQMGFPLEIKREYDSHRSGSGDFGPGWNLSASNIKGAATTPLGTNWDQEVGGDFLTIYYLIEKKRHVVMIRLSDEAVYKFRMDVNPKSSTLYPIENHMDLTVGYLCQDGKGATLEALDFDAHVMLSYGELLEWGSRPYDP